MEEWNGRGFEKDERRWGKEEEIKKMKKRNFVIVKTEDGKYNIALRNYPEHPLDKNGFYTKRYAKKRLKEYIKNVKER